MFKYKHSAFIILFFPFPWRDFVTWWLYWWQVLFIYDCYCICVFGIPGMWSCIPFSHTETYVLQPLPLSSQFLHGSGKLLNFLSFCRFEFWWYAYLTCFVFYMYATLLYNNSALLVNSLVVSPCGLGFYSAISSEWQSRQQGSPKEHESPDGYLVKRLGFMLVLHFTQLLHHVHRMEVNLMIFFFLTQDIWLNHTIRVVDNCCSWLQVCIVWCVNLSVWGLGKCMVQW